MAKLPSMFKYNNMPLDTPLLCFLEYEMGRCANYKGLVDRIQSYCDDFNQKYTSRENSHGMAMLNKQRDEKLKLMKFTAFVTNRVIYYLQHAVNE